MDSSGRFDDEIHDDEDSSEEPSEPSDGSQEDGEMVDTSITLGQRLAIIVQTTINNMLKVRPEIYQLTSDKVDINDISDDSNPDVKYMRLSFSDSEYRYYLTFDVSKLLENETLDSYLVFLQYSKISKY